MKVNFNISVPNMRYSKKIAFSAVSINQKPQNSETDAVQKIQGYLDRMPDDKSFEAYQRQQKRLDSIHDIQKQTGSWIDWENVSLTKKTRQEKAPILLEKQAILNSLTDEFIRARGVTNEVEKELESVNVQRKERVKSLNSLLDSRYRKNKGFSQIAGYNSEKEILYKYFISQIDKQKEGQDVQIPSAVLFFGPKGNGKTTFATAFAQEIGCEKPIKVRANILSQNDMKKFLKRLENAAKEAREKYEQTGNIQVLFLDEVDVVATKKSTILPELEEFLRTCYQKYHCVAFCATNFPLELSLPLAGESCVFDYVVSVDPPSKENKIEILKYYLDGRTDKKLTDKEYEKLADIMERQESVGGAYSVASIRNDICNANSDKKVRIEEIFDALYLQNIKPNISEEQLSSYYDAMNVIMKNRVDE